MKQITFLLFLIFTITNSFAQSGNQPREMRNRADRFYNEEQYNLAIEYYQELSRLSDQDATINFQLAESYRKTFKYVEAEAYYLKSYFQAEEQFPLALYYYALMLKLNGQFDESIRYFTLFLSANENKTELSEFLEQTIIDRAGSEMAKIEIAKAPSPYPIRLESLNSAFNDYAPAVLDSTTLVITSGRISSNRSVIDERYGEAFTDNFYFTKTENVWHDKTKQIFSITNSRYNDGSGCFNRTGDKYYFTICGKEREQCMIYFSTLKEGIWTEPVALNDNINYKTFEAKHPAVSKGGDTLLFASNRTGGFGKYDIWMSVNSGVENWGPAMNMGNVINTGLNELSPSFTDVPHTFFLSSDGHQNYGGLDLYMAKTFSNGQVALYNLDYPFNSTYDDCFIRFADRKVYFSSNRKGGIGGFDIYAATIPSTISFISKLSLKNRDARGDVKLNARTAKVNTLDLLTARNEDRIEYESLTYEKKKIVDKIIYNKIHNIPTQASDFLGVVESDYKILLQVSEARYKEHEIEKTYAKTFLTRVILPFDSLQGVSITGLLTDSASGVVFTNTKILLLDESGEVLKTTQTNNVGRFRFTNISSQRNVYLRLEQRDENTLQKLQVSDLSFVNFKGQRVYNFENIYFDFDQYSLRPEAELVLNELAEVLLATPSMQVEVFAYADDRGKDEYNLILTQKRGQAVMHYLASRGVDQTAIAVTAKGRQENSSTYIEIQRQVNRRVEFYLNGETINATPSAKTYILKKKSDWNSISTSTGVSVSELKKLNGAAEDKIHIYQPIRIPYTVKVISDILFFRII